MRPEVNSNRFEISLRGKVSIWCKVTSLSAFRWFQVKWNSLRCRFHFGQWNQSEISNCSHFSMSTVNASTEIKLHRIIKLTNNAHVLSQCHNICFASIKFTLIKIYQLHMCNKVLLWFRKLPQWNIHVRLCQIDFFFSITCTHAKKLGALNLFIKKLACQLFLFIIGEKKNKESLPIII